MLAQHLQLGRVLIGQGQHVIQRGRVQRRFQPSLVHGNSAHIQVVHSHGEGVRVEGRIFKCSGRIVIPDPC
eukprot:1582274-Pleurochrysis_carterae.AAC.1